MFVIQYIIIFFALFAFIKVLLRFKNKELTVFELLVWSGLWFGVIGVTIFPNVTNKIADFVGIGRGADLVIYCSIIVLFYLFFRILVRVHQLNRTVTRLIRKNAVEHTVDNRKSKT